MPSKTDTLKFTPAEYEKYQQLPLWATDDEDFKSEADYESYWSKEIGKWRQQSVDQYKNITTEWQNAIDYVEGIPAKTYDTFVPDSAIAQDKLPITLCSIMEVIATLFSNYPQPAFMSPSEDEDQYANALQQLCSIELKANDFSSLMFDVGLDTGFGLGVLKAYIDPDQTGPYGQEGKIVIERMDPLQINVDPKAKRLLWSHMRFLVSTEKMDIGVARRQFPAAKAKISKWSRGVDADDVKEGMHGSNLESPVANPIDSTAEDRNRIEIMECWFKDDREKFDADLESIPNTPTKVDDDGQLVTNPDYDKEAGDIIVRPQVDEDGYVVGRWVPAYPDGRCICIAGSKFVVADFANPFMHGQAPFIFFRSRPSRKAISTGDLTNIIRIDRKLNDLYERIHVMAQAEIERPLLADLNFFKTPRKWFYMSGQAHAVIVKNPGREMARMPFTEIPQFVWLYIAKLEQALDKVKAIAGIMQGQLAEGSQLSAETVSSLQGMANSVLKMKAELIAEGIKQLGYQMQWLIRQNYEEAITVTVTAPDGTKKSIPFNSADKTLDYLVDVQSASGMPGAHQAAPQQIIPLFANGLIDRPAALQAMRWGQWHDVVQRMKQDEIERIQAEAFGRAEGLGIKKLEKDNQSGAEGRKPKM